MCMFRMVLSSALEVRTFGKSAGLVIKRLQGQISAGAVGEFSSPDLIFVLTLIQCLLL